MTAVAVTKTCRDCGLTKSTDEFHRASSTRDGRNIYCKPCAIARTKRWEGSADPEVLRAKRRRAHKSRLERGLVRGDKYRHRYGISIEDYDRLFELQGGVCAACSRPPEVGEPLPVDHDHLTGQVRGLLCGGCNKALGLLRDDVQVIKGLLIYLEGGQQSSI